MNKIQHLVIQPILPGRRMIALMFVGACFLVTAGCGSGSMSQEDLKRYAVQQPDNDDNAEPAPASAAASAAAALNKSPGQPGPDSSNDKKAMKAPTASTKSAPAAVTTAAAPEPATVKAIAASIPSAAVSDTKSAPSTPLDADARARQTVDNLTRIADAMQAYVGDKRAFPTRAIVDQEQIPLLSWRVALLPYLGHKELYEQFRLTEPWDSPYNRALIALIPSVYQSPERFDEKTNYLLPISSSTIYSHPRGVPRNMMEDGPANTVVMLEVDDPAAVTWTEPRDYDLDPKAPTNNLGALRGDSYYVVWGDGKIGRVLTSASVAHVRAMYTFSAGELFSADKLNQPLFAKSATAKDAAVVSSSSTQLHAAGTPSVDEMTTALSATYLNRAATEFERGAELEASQWFYAAALTAPTGATWTERYQWAPGLKRPTPLLRFGVGLQYNGRRRTQFEQDSAMKLKQGAVTGKSSWSAVTGKMGEAVLQPITAHAERFATSLLGEIGGNANRRGPVRSAAPPRRPALLASSPHGERLAPGVFYLTMADEPILRQLARRQGIDVLVLVDWRDPGHKQSVRFELFDVARDASIFQLPWIDSTDVVEAFSSPLAGNPVAKSVRQLAEFLETQLALQPFPAQIQPRHVASRLTALTASKPENPLGTLAEMRYYRERGLADDAQLLLAYQALIGQREGSELFLGDAATRERVLKPWLPQPPATNLPLRAASANDDE